MSTSTKRIFLLFISIVVIILVYILYSKGKDIEYGSVSDCVSTPVLVPRTF